MPRFRLRTLLIAAAIVAVVLATIRELRRRSERFSRLAAEHIANLRLETHFNIDTPVGLNRLASFHEWHSSMAEKYRYHARYPWLPVEPDPPEPK